MGRLIVTEFVTLDGVAQGPGGADEDRTDGFELGGWQAPLTDAESGETMFAEAATMDALLLGRKTYDIFAAYWPRFDGGGFGGLLNSVPRYVATRTLIDPLAWSGASALQGDLADAVASLKAEYDETHVIGSLNLVQSLLDSRLVDQLRLWVYPVVLGAGKRLFEPGIAPQGMVLLSAESFPGGAIHLTYEPTGYPDFATMPDPDPEPDPTP